VITLYAATYSEWVTAQEEIHKYGITIESGLGSMKANPAVAISNRASRMMVKLLTVLGLTPDARERAAPLSAAKQGQEAARKTAGTFLKIAAERKPG
jgi:P27 family predicted phage terminase small subunit